MLIPFLNIFGYFLQKKDMQLLSCHYFEGVLSFMTLIYLFAKDVLKK